jgi:hypothetical protein
MVQGSAEEQAHKTLARDACSKHELEVRGV